MGYHALVFGASGIQGWAVVDQLLKDYPTPDTFDRVTALTNRPVTEKMLWPSSSKLEIISGINLLTEKGQEGLEQDLRERVPGVESVSHVFFLAYVFKEKPEDEIEVNVRLLQRAVTAVELISTKLKFVVIATGTKAYGIHCLTDFPFADKLPLSEDLPRIPEPWRSQNFYYYQTDWLETESKGKPWTFCELRPDLVVGFVPNNNMYCLAQILALYLACYQRVEGKGAECAFPGTQKSWENVWNDSGQDIIARFAIHAALHPDASGQGQAFNVASNSTAASWSERWPIICEFFGLKGTPPPVHGTGPQPGDYLAEHEAAWKKVESEFGLVPGRVEEARSKADFAGSIMNLMDFDRQVDLTKQHKAWQRSGEVQEADSKEVWWTAFQRFRDAKIIP